MLLTHEEVAVNDKGVLKDALFLWIQEPDKGRTSMDQKKRGLKIAIFFCQTIDAEQDVNRRPFEAAGCEFDPALNNE